MPNLWFVQTHAGQSRVCLQNMRSGNDNGKDRRRVANDHYTIAKVRIRRANKRFLTELIQLTIIIMSIIGIAAVLALVNSDIAK